jgi:thiol-disulfide isomerase/thioredoxin
MMATRGIRCITKAVFAVVAMHASITCATERTGVRNEIVELRQSDDSLRATYAKDKRMNLPRLLLLDAQGRPLLVEIGLRDGVGRRMANALEKDAPMQTPITLDFALSEIVDARGKPVSAQDLPRADAYVVDYWAQWCAPCRMLAHDIESQLHRWEHDGRHVVWLKVESDPDKLPKDSKA